ncbi:MAG: HD-GYP domain-containing protein [Planctomycetota bacterium]|jgi:putative nucleotidyltransferase with HDIG domain
MSDEKLEKILFVDDEESILDIACAFFQRKGYEVVTAQNGLEAIKVLEQDDIDCCFTDINMPGMNGLELAEYIQKADNTIPVIIMTGYPSLDNTIKTLKNGVVDFLIKPVNLNQMELCVRRVFSQRHLFVENILLKKEVESKQRLEKLNRELMVKVEELNILNKILTDFSATSSSHDVFKRLVDTAVEITHADVARFYVINENVQSPVEVTRSPVLELQKGSTDPAYKASENTELSHNDEKNLDGKQSLEHLIMEIASDEIPLLVSENNGGHGIPANILSATFVPLKIREKVFGVLVTAVERGETRLTEKDLYYLAFMSQNAANAIENLALYENIYENLFATLYAFVNALEVRDLYTQQHSSRVTEISIVIGEALGCTSEELDVLNFAGHLHDIGKIGIPDNILLKPDRLNREEFETIKTHPAIGANIVEQLGLWEMERQIIKYHHERFDGTGYPEGLKGEDIPFLARILSVADVYDAISSDRAYRRKMEESKVLSIISEGSGSQFDPQIVEVFLNLYHQGKFIATETPQSKPNILPKN